MRMLVIETASEACSVALFEGDSLLAHDHRVLGRGHAEALVPMIAALPEKGQAQRILVSLGPGSFTGVRIGLATARALGVAWQAEVLGYPTLALVAAIAQRAHPDQPLIVSMKGGHGEWFVQPFDKGGLPLEGALSLAPAEAVARYPTALVAGSTATDFAELRQDQVAVIDSLPDAVHAPLVPAALLTPARAPIYGRPPDAKPQAELALQ